MCVYISNTVVYRQCTVTAIRVVAAFHNTLTFCYNTYPTLSQAQRIPTTTTITTHSARAYSACGIDFTASPSVASPGTADLAFLANSGVMHRV